jgi:hypothetical protein
MIILAALGEQALKCKNEFRVLITVILDAERIDAAEECDATGVSL